MPRKVIGSMLIALLASLHAAGQAKNAPTSGRSQKQPYTLQVYSRAVLTDVTVTDRHGNPVTGLTAKDFQILDNGKPQLLASFDEHRKQMAPLKKASATPGVFSNQFLRNPPAQVNAILFDTTTIHVVDQMYLFQQMKELVKNLPRGDSVAVFTRWGDATLQLSEFTDDHAALLAAIARAIPRLQSSSSWIANDLDTLRDMAIYLNQLPGRKNLIWFTSGSNLFLNTGADINPMLSATPNATDRRAIYDALEAERIAIYPIDARGLMTRQPNAFQQLQMRQDAEATGGQAYMNTNGLAQATNHVLSTDGFFYTLTYSPQDLKNDGNWHRVEVKLDRKGYELSYRRGYYDDGSNQPGAQGKTGTFFTASAKKIEVPTNRSEPIIFSAQVEPAPAAAGVSPPLKPGEQRYVVRFSIAARDIRSAKVERDVGTDVLGSAILAFDHNGGTVAKRWQKVTLSVDHARERDLADAQIAFTQTVDLPKGRDYLYLGVWDAVTGRMGTVNAEVEVGRRGNR